MPSLASIDQESRSNPARGGATPRYRPIAAARIAKKGRLLTAFVACAGYIAVMTSCACTRSPTVNPGEGLEKADANRPPLTLEQISHLDQKAFEHSLPQLRRVIEQSSPEAVMDQDTLIALTGKLRQTDESAADYWPTVLRFLQFASFVMAPKVPQGEQPKALSDILSVGIMRGIREFDKTILFDAGSLGNGSFTNCRIIFTQHAVHMQNVKFDVCGFEFPATDTPSPYLKKVSRVLLSSDLGSVSIPSL